MINQPWRYFHENKLDLKEKGGMWTIANLTLIRKLIVYLFWFVTVATYHLVSIWDYWIWFVLFYIAFLYSWSIDYYKLIINLLLTMCPLIFLEYWLLLTYYLNRWVSQLSFISYFSKIYFLTECLFQGMVSQFRCERTTRQDKWGANILLKIFHFLYLFYSSHKYGLSNYINFDT